MTEPRAQAALDPHFFMEAGQLGYAAGLIDADGGFTPQRRVSKSGTRYSVYLRVSNTHAGSIEALRSIFGLGTVNQQLRPNKKPTSVWYCGPTDLPEVLARTRPFLKIKAGAADCAERLLRAEPGSQEQERMFLALRCMRGRKGRYGW